MTGEQLWVREELGAVAFGDRRLTERLVQTAECLAAQPNASIPQACGTWAATKGAYRLFDNKKTTPEAVLASHRAATLKRMAAHKTVLAVQDTTILDFTHRMGLTGTGPVGNFPGKGLLLHSTLAVSTAGVPLGLLTQHVWARKLSEYGKRHRRAQRPTKEKESQRWITALQRSRSGVPQEIRLVMVGDREADIYDLFHAAYGQTDLLIRATQNRILRNPEKRLRARLQAAPIAGYYTITVPRADDKPSRSATLEVRYTDVLIRPPKCRKGRKHWPNLPLYAVWAVERKPPVGVEPIEWRLLTTVPVHSFAEAMERIVWYTRRWTIERYHFTIKSGCRIEDRQFDTAYRLKRCLAIYMVIAWRLLWLTYQARHTPEVPCTVALTTPEWQALACVMAGTDKPPKRPPSLKEAVRALARLGGFLGRRRDGEPGVRVLWRGWQRLQDLAQLWQLLRPPGKRKDPVYRRRGHHRAPFQPL